MAYLTTSSSVEDFYDSLYYSLARTEAHPIALKYAPHLQSSIDGLGKAVGERNAKANTQQKLMAKRDFARDSMVDAFLPYTLQVAAHFGAKTAPEALRLVLWSPSSLGVLPLKSLPTAIAQWKSQLDLPATPAEVKKFAKPVLDHWDGLQKAQAAVEAGALNLKNAIVAVDKAKNAALDTLAKTRAGLAGDFPRQSKVVARFFVKQKKRGSKDETDPNGGSGT